MGKMPVYSFHCKACGAEFSKFVKTVKEKGQVKCPCCDSQELRRLFRPFNYVRITEKYDPACPNASNCLSAKKFGCGKYAKAPSSGLETP